jgi:hypothetical protein
MDSSPDLQKQFARERSNQDIQATVEYGKTLFQMLIGSNGLAATALLTLAGALKQPSLTLAISFPVFIYLVGVYCGTQGAIDLFHSKGRYGYRWQLRFFEGSKDEEERERQDAETLEASAIRWINRSGWPFWLGVLEPSLRSLRYGFSPNLPRKSPSSRKATFRKRPIRQ